jgi:hypothetical protein
MNTEVAVFNIRIFCTTKNAAETSGIFIKLKFITLKILQLYPLQPYTDPF